ncbi:hypothetical protein [Lederbergia lenta]|uniref:hypothetical protein n=1 Tax=Lederbergia lenta TaxID=1467 RepID=UPI00203F1584|nr:hypothetical protein [Lederbergia lenta]MCM3109531.1 hypothetical protein [Lederbergia lenta]
MIKHGFIKYFIRSLAIILILYMGMDVELMLYKYQNETGIVVPYMLFTILFPILAGMSIHIPRIVINLFHKNRFSIDWVKLFSTSLPFLFISFSYYILNTTLTTNILPHSYRVKLMETQTIVTISGVILGYMILNSFKKRDE